MEIPRKTKEKNLHNTLSKRKKWPKQKEEWPQQKRKNDRKRTPPLLRAMHMKYYDESQGRSDHDMPKNEKVHPRRGRIF